MTKKQTEQTLPTFRKSTPIWVKDLNLDPENPRLAGLNLTVNDQEEILKVLWTERAVNELVDSIATTGYWQHEELFAASVVSLK
jgi:hypothetical protein